jgi:hypothetical protein
MDNKKFIEEWISREGYGKRVKFYGENPRAVIFGESHMCRNHALGQLKLLEDLSSGLLIHEFARNYIIDLAGKRIYENPDYPASEEARNFARGEAEEGGSMLPGFLDEQFKEWIKEKEFVNLLRKYESAYFAMDFDGDSSLSAILRRLPVCLKTIAGCDFSYAEKDFYEAQNGIRLCSKFCPRKHQAFRERRFAEVIGKYALSSPELVVAVMGGNHIERYSKIHSGLKERGVEYACVNQR